MLPIAPVSRGEPVTSSSRQKPKVACRHARQILSVQHKMRDAPFERLFHARRMAMHQFAQMGQDRLRKGLCLRDIGVDAGVAAYAGHLAATR
jgi:hypothetical protein